MEIRYKFNRRKLNNDMSFISHQRYEILGFTMYTWKQIKKLMHQRFLLSIELRYFNVISTNNFRNWSCVCIAVFKYSMRTWE